MYRARPSQHVTNIAIDAVARYSGLHPMGLQLSTSAAIALRGHSFRDVLARLRLHRAEFPEELDALRRSSSSSPHSVSGVSNSLSDRNYDYEPWTLVRRPFCQHGGQLIAWGFAAWAPDERPPPNRCGSERPKFGTIITPCTELLARILFKRRSGKRWPATPRRTTFGRGRCLGVPLGMERPTSILTWVVHSLICTACAKPVQAERSNTDVFVLPDLPTCRETIIFT